MAERRSPRRVEVGAIYSYRRADGRFGACQITGNAPYGKVEVVQLPETWERPPTPEQVARSTGGSKHRTNLDAELPWWLTLVAVLPKLPRCDDPSLVSSSWRTACNQPCYAARKQERERVRGAPTPARERTVVCEGGDEAAFLSSLRELVPREAVLRRPTLARIDLTSTMLDKLRVEVGDCVVEILLPNGLRELSLSGQVENVRIACESAAFPFCLDLRTKTLALVAGLETLEALEATGLATADIRVLEKYERLTEAVLVGNPGSIVHVEAFGALATLRHLSLHELYDLDGDAFPEAWPALETVSIKGLRASAARTLKRRLATVPSLRIEGARSDEWIADNLSNPFRAWDEAEPDLGAAARKAWSSAKKAVKKALPKPSKKDTEAILRSFVKALDRLDAKYDLDTVRRDEAADAFVALAGELGVDRKRALAALEAWRKV